MMRGAATVATADDTATVEEIRAITRRYIVPEEVEGYIARWPDLRTIVTITPAHIVSWSAGGETLSALAHLGPWSRFMMPARRGRGIRRSPG
jgi:hypothetical protein